MHKVTLAKGMCSLYKVKTQARYRADKQGERKGDLPLSSMVYRRNRFTEISMIIYLLGEYVFVFFVGILLLS